MMKVRRALSGLLFGTGCAVTFLGVLALLLPKINNTQLQLVLASFETPSRFAVVNAMNAFMRFALRQSWELLGVGVLCLGVGAWLFGRFTQPEAAPESPPASAPEPPAEVVDEPIAEQPNPFAVYRPEPSPTLFAPKAAPEPETISYAAYHRPILEENAIDPEPVRIPPSFAEESRAIASELGDESPSGLRMILRTPQPLEAAAPEAESAPIAAPASAADEKESPPSPVPPVSSRIRSTMGWHKQW